MYAILGGHLTAQAGASAERSELLFYMRRVRSIYLFSRFSIFKIYLQFFVPMFFVKGSTELSSS